MAYDEALAARVRNALSVAGELREQKMMGALCFMIDGHMCCGVTGSALRRPKSQVFPQERFIQQYPDYVKTREKFQAELGEYEAGNH